jgi:hypothetical protein
MNIHFYPFVQELVGGSGHQPAQVLRRGWVRIVDLTETAVTEKELAELRRAKPNAQIFC